MTQKTKKIKFKKVVKYDFKAAINPISNPILMIGIVYVMIAIGTSLWTHELFKNIFWIAAGSMIIITLIILFFTREVHWEKIK